jgi:DNA repair exonuclease SbcCD ATPase subunit
MQMQASTKSSRTQKAIEEKEHIIEELKENLRAVEEQDVEAGKLRDEIEDLQADMGEKDRIIEEREEEIVRIICCPSIMDLTNCGDRTSSRSMLIRTQPLLQSWKSIWNPLRRKFKTFEIRLSMRNLKRQKHESTARRRATKQRAEDDLNEASVSRIHRNGQLSNVIFK